MTFIVAEIGVNWDGDFELAKEMIARAKESNCDAVKFQSYNEELIGSHPEKERLMKATVSEKNVKEIDHIAKSIGIEWFSTPMYPEAVDFLDPYVERFKIRELDGRLVKENYTSNLLEKVLDTGKDVIISSQNIPPNNNFRSKIKWLYCVPKYPCELSELNFENLDKFDGYSNHCPHIIAPLTASILGTRIIEVHVTIDKNRNFIDNNVSFDFEELKNLTKLIRLEEKIKK